MTKISKSKLSKLRRYRCGGTPAPRVQSEGRIKYRQLKGDLPGQALIAALQASPHCDLDIETGRTAMPVRGVRL